MRYPNIRCAILCLAAAVALVVPALAGAATPNEGKFAGDAGVSFVVGRSPHGTPTIKGAEYEALIGGHLRIVSGFAEAFAHDGSFRTCGRYGHSQTVFREYCIVGHFGTHGSAEGTVDVFQGAYHHVQTRPFETHTWSATLQ